MENYAVTELKKQNVSAETRLPAVFPAALMSPSCQPTPLLSARRRLSVRLKPGLVIVTCQPVSVETDRLVYWLFLRWLSPSPLCCWCHVCRAWFA